MSTLVIDISPETYRRLEEQARDAGKAPEALSRELIEAALRESRPPVPKEARDVLEALDRVRPLSDTLRAKIVPGVTLDEVRAALTEASGRPLSEIVLEGRGPKP